MPRRKITIEEAMQTLQSAGLNVRVESVKSDEADTISVKKGFKNPVFPMDDYSVVQQTKSPQTVKITLWAKHCIGQGGVVDEHGNMEEASLVTYGPGICTVPVKVAQSLLHQDMLAKQADDRFLDRTQRSYLIVSGIRSDGSRSIVGKMVDNNILDDFSLNNTAAIIV